MFRIPVRKILFFVLIGWRTIGLSARAADGDQARRLLGHLLV